MGQNLTFLHRDWNYNSISLNCWENEKMYLIGTLQNIDQDRQMDEQTMPTLELISGMKSNSQIHCCQAWGP